MAAGFIIFALIVLFMVGGLLAFKASSKFPMPKNLPPPLPDEDQQDE